jgi:glycine hydroxymethyltransferase
MRNLRQSDRRVFRLIKLEEKRQQNVLRLIPSENYAGPAVREAEASLLMNKYSEGYPKKRYYQGQKYTDRVEDLARERAKKLFKVAHVNVQPYSGSPANFAVYFSLLKPGDTVMGMSLPHGGHLTHGWKVSITGSWFKAVQYAVDKKTQLIDYQQVEKMAKKYKPKIIWAGATAYPRFFDWKRFGEIAEAIGAYFCADIAHIAGLIVADAHPSPAPFAHLITTTTHKSLRGPRGAMIMVTHRGVRKDPGLPKKIDRAVFPGLQGGPHQHTIGAIAVALREAQGKQFKKYGHQIVKNAKVLASELMSRDFNLVTGGTDNHKMLIDMRNKKMLGKEAAVKLEKANIIVNKNAIPFDPNPPARPSGIRLGTPAVTTRGMKEKEMRLIGEWISDVIEGKRSCQKIKRSVIQLCQKFPIP